MPPLRVLPSLALALLLATASGAVPRAAPTTLPVSTVPIYVAYPKNGAKVAYDHVILEGSVLPGATLSLNGRPLAVGPDGLYSEWLPLRPGPNTLNLVSTLNGQTSVVQYNVTSNPPVPLAANPARIVPGSLTPDGGWMRYGAATLGLPDRRLTFSFRGSPGGRAMFWLGASGPFGMTETSAGRYSGTYTLKNSDAFQKAAVRVQLSSPGGTLAQASAPGTVSSLPGPRFAEVTAADLGRGVNPYQLAWAPPGGIATVYPRQGVRFRVVGENAGNFLTRLPGKPAPDEAELPLLEVTRGTARLLPVGTGLTSAQLSAPELQDTGSHLALRLPLGAKVPYLLTQTPQGLRLSLWDTLGDPASLTATPLSDPLVAQLSWSRTGSGPLTADIQLTTRQQWGYDAVYDGSDLVLQMRRPPHAPADPALPLSGRTIVVDPGHGGGEQGGAGALRVNEKDIVLDIGRQLAARLRTQGANVVLTRQSDVQVPLYARDTLAETLDADLLISVHANALPDGTDPKGRRGAGVYWTQPQAGPLAERILEAITGDPVLSATGQPGNDGLHPGADLALTRPSTQISLLVETAYLTDPGNLRSLMSPEGRSAYAGAIARGVASFYTDAAQP